MHWTRAAIWSWKMDALTRRSLVSADVICEYQHAIRSWTNPAECAFDAKEAGWTPIVSSTDLPLAKAISLFGLIGFVLAGYWCLPQVIVSMEMSSRLMIAAPGAFPIFAMIPLHEFCHCLGYLVPLTSRSLISGIAHTRRLSSL
jgi:hypothetical protein